MKKMLLLLIIFVVTPIPLSAAETLIVGYAGDYPPFQYAAGNKRVGICPAIIENAASALGYEVVYKLFPWKRMLYMAQIGQVDAIMPLFKTDKRENFLYFPESPLAFEENVFFTHKGSGITYDGDLNNIKNLIIGVVADYSYGPLFDDAANLKKDAARNDLRLVEKFKANRFPIGIGNKYVIQYFANQLNMSDLVFLTPAVTQSPLYIGFSKAKGHQALAKKFSKAMIANKSTPKYIEAKQKYGF